MYDSDPIPYLYCLLVYTIINASAIYTIAVRRREWDRRGGDPGHLMNLYLEVGITINKIIGRQIFAR